MDDADPAAEMEKLFLAAAHDLKAPLRTMSAFADALAEDYGDVLDDRGLEYLGHMTTGAAEMRHLIEQMLLLAQLGQAPLAVREISIEALILACVDNVLAETDAVRPNITSASSIPFARADEAKLKAALENVIDNAVKFSAPDKESEIEIGAENIDGWIVITVRDRGIGMTSEQVETCIKPFTRFHPARDYPGAGLGLSIAHRALAQHGGSLSITSEPNIGTRVQLRFLVS